MLSLIVCNEGNYYQSWLYMWGGWVAQIKPGRRHQKRAWFQLCSWYPRDKAHWLQNERINLAVSYPVEIYAVDANRKILLRDSISALTGFLRNFRQNLFFLSPSSGSR